ncbi:hypothetical protein EVAR_44191_1 [Eumeta japonica]|uniref:Uncharacterized protein n=1 Tax=Eumeta variegata TaxID=151549 RepID=A0A4C1W0S4_EUMVA|nr:hypothetical protein EVAR_44191_1 [Eumeta japonica]
MRTKKRNAFKQNKPVIPRADVIEFQHDAITPRLRRRWDRWFRARAPPPSSRLSAGSRRRAFADNPRRAAHSPSQVRLRSVDVADCRCAGVRFV